MSDSKDQREIKISQNYFINQINITNLKNRLIKQTKSKKSSIESEENSNFERVGGSSKGGQAGTIDLNEDNVKLESESEVQDSEIIGTSGGKKREEERDKFYYTPGNLNNNRLKNIFRTDKPDAKKTKKGALTSSKHEVSNKDLIETLKTKYGPKNSQSTSSYLGDKKTSNVFSKPSSFDFLGKGKRSLNKINKLKKENFVKKYSEGVGFGKVRQAKHGKSQIGRKSFYDSFKFKDRKLKDKNIKSSGKKKNTKKRQGSKQLKKPSMFESSLAKLNKLSQQRHSYSGKGKTNMSKSKSTYFSSTTNIHNNNGKKEKKLTKNYSGVDFVNRRKSRNTYTGKRRKRVVLAGNKTGNGQVKRKKKLSRYGQIKKKLEFSNPGYAKGGKIKRLADQLGKRKRSKSQFRSNSFDKGYMERLFPRRSVKRKTMRRNQSLQIDLEDVKLKKEAEPKEGDSAYRQELRASQIQFKLVPKVESFTMRTRRGKNGDEDKTNQDSFIAQPNFSGNQGLHIFGVYDGHGAQGHLVSNYISSQLPHIVNTIKNADEHFKNNPEVLLTEAYHFLFETLVSGPIDVTFSGSTAITCYIQDNKIYTANAGDSRAIIGVKNKEIGWYLTPLSRDHKPGLPDERKRIEECGGRISPYIIEGEAYGPNRVWVKEEEIPGLAMSRSLGDLVAASVGVSWMPEVICHEISVEDRFLIIASDGVWEFLENEVVLELMARYRDANDIEGACDELMKMSLQSWIDDEDGCIDDITFVVVFFGTEEVQVAI